MLYAYNNTTQTKATNEALQIANVSIQTGCTATTAVGDDFIALNKAGFYKIDVSVTGTVPVALSRTAQEKTTTKISNSTAMTIQMHVANSAYPGAVATQQVADDIEGTLAFSSIVQICKPCACNQSYFPVMVSFVNAGEEIEYSNFAVTVTKLC